MEALPEPEKQQPHEFAVAKVVEIPAQRHRVTFDSFAIDNALAYIEKAKVFPIRTEPDDLVA